MFESQEVGQKAQDDILLHLICECIKWTAIVRVPSKASDVLFNAVTMKWLMPFGLPEMMVWDGEGSRRSDEAQIWADRRGFKLHIKPKGPKSCIAERHHEIMRIQLH